MSSNEPLSQAVKSLQKKIEELTIQAKCASLTPQSRKATNKSIEEAAQALARLTAELDR